MSSSSVLAAHGIVRPDDVIRIAAEEGLDLAAAVTLLLKESYGGLNVWGHDEVATAGTYVKGAEVTKSAYQMYLAAVRAGRAGRQGVGPCQLTWSGYQEQADALGGCWDWASNVRIGFRALAGLIRNHGLHDGFRAYNGSGPAAERYANDALDLHAVWTARLGPVPADSGRHTALRFGDTGYAVHQLQVFLNVTFPAYSQIDLGPQRYGPQTVSVVAEFQRRAGVTGPDADGTVVGPRTLAALARFGYR